jgi:hypothetical protein
MQSALRLTDFQFRPIAFLTQTHYFLALAVFSFPGVETGGGGGGGENSGKNKTFVVDWTGVKE